MALRRMPDISHWQGPVNFSTMKGRGIGDVLIKAWEGEKGQDVNAVENICKAHDAGLAVSAYLFFKPLQDPLIQAVNFVSFAQKTKIPISAYVLDVEDPPTGALPHSSRLLSCLLEIEKQAGMRPAIYTRSSFWRLYYPGAYNWAGFYPLMIAHYKSFSGPDVCPPWYPGCEVAWQYTDRENGPLFGTQSKQIDMSILYNWPAQELVSIDPAHLAYLAELPLVYAPPKPTFQDLLTETRFLFSFNPRKG